MSDFERKQVLERDKAIFQKAVKLYFFVNHVKHAELHPELKDKFTHCANIIYSMLRGYMEEGKFQIEYLDYLNEEITSWHKSDKKLFANFQIQPEEIEEIELSGQVPLQFRDAETGEQMRLMYHSDEGFCDYAIMNLN